MIESFKSKDLKKLREGKRTKLPSDLLEAIADQLSVLDAAISLEDLRIPPSNHLEALKGNRKGQHSIKVNDQYRLCFIWNDGKAEKVEFTDYH